MRKTVDSEHDNTEAKICQYDKNDIDCRSSETDQNKNYKCATIDFYFVGHWLSLVTIVSDIIVSGKISWSLLKIVTPMHKIP